jgi:hypothetical protein
VNSLAKKDILASQVNSLAEKEGVKIVSS